MRVASAASSRWGQGIVVAGGPTARRRDEEYWLVFRGAVTQRMGPPRPRGLISPRRRCTSVRIVVGVVLSLWSPTAHAQQADVPHALQAGTPEALTDDAVTLDDAAAATEPPVTAERISAALSRYRHEPSLEEVTNAALAHQRIDPERVSRLASQARVSAWLPKLRLSATRGQTIALLAAQSTTVDRNSATTGDNVTLQAQLNWDLANLIWSNRELQVEREWRAERKAMQELVQWASALYFERRRLQVERDVSGSVSVTVEMRIAEIEGVLDVLTDGAFSRALRGSRPSH